MKKGISTSKEPFIAYRSWACCLAHGPQPVLEAVAFGFQWTPRKAMVAPGAPGYHGFKEPNDPNFHDFLGFPIVGRVALWGDVLEATGGYYGSCAYPQILYTHPRLPNKVIAEVANNYCIDTAPAPQEMAKVLDSVWKHYPKMEWVQMPHGRHLWIAASC